MNVRWILGIGLIAVAATSVPEMHVARAQDGARNIVVERAQQFVKGRKWAVVIGVNRYLDETIPSLHFCVEDTDRLVNTLATRCGYERSDILVLNDLQVDPKHKPLRFNLEKQVRDWLAHARAGDTVLVYFSGHGFLDKQGNGYLAPHDCQQTDLQGSGLRTSKLREWLDASPADQKLLILDCCHAAGRDKDKHSTESERLAKGFAQAKGLITLASCKEDEISLEWKEVQQGLYSFFLANGLEGAADENGDQMIDTRELQSLLEVEVPRQAKKLGGKQTPVIMKGAEVQGEFLLARLSRTVLPPPFYLGKPLAPVGGVEVPPLVNDFGRLMEVAQRRNGRPSIVPAGAPPLPTALMAPPGKRAVDALGASRAKPEQEASLSRAETLANSEPDAARRAYAWAGIANTRAILLDRAGYGRAQDATFASATEIADASTAVSVLWRLTHLWLRCGDEPALYRTLDDLHGAVSQLKSGADRYPWLARLAGLNLALGRDVQAGEFYDAAQRAIEGGGLHSHIAVREDYQYHARVIAYCAARRLDLAVRRDNFPKSFARIDKARFRAQAELAVAAARLGDAATYTTFVSATEAQLAGRREPDIDWGRRQLAEALALAGHVERGRKVAEEIKEEALRAEALCLVGWTQAERQRPHQALEVFERMPDCPERVFLCHPLAREAQRVKLPSLASWTDQLVHPGERAAAQAGLVAGQE